MSTYLTSPPLAPTLDINATNGGDIADNEVIEVSLLLPASWAQHLMLLSRQRRQSVGQILRSMIGQALHDGGGES
jgi:hypothetical protein